VAANFLIDAESNLKAAISGFSSAPPAAPAKVETPSATDAGTAKGAGHQAEGTVDGVDTGTGAITLSHGPVASLKWPSMTMEFKAANPSLLAALKPGAKVSFEFIERQPGEWVITSVKPMGAR
jgi:Cu(I)/Ag(I) efflux system membrane fusion protein